MTDVDQRADVAASAARAGAEEAYRAFRAPVDVETKANKNDLVTETDRSAQRTVIQRVRAAYPDEPIVAEEDDAPTHVPASGPVWVIDPIDGTANYVRGIRIWATSVAAVLDGETVGAATVTPAMDDEYTADRSRGYRNDASLAVSERDDPETFTVAVLGWGPEGDRAEYATLATTVIERFGDLRRFGSMQTALAFVASGELDAAVTTRRPAPWDSIAGAHLVERAGGTVTDADGDRWRHDSEAMVVSNGRDHEAVLEAARTVR